MRGDEIEKFWKEKAKEAQWLEEQRKLIGDSRVNLAVGELADVLGGQKLGGGETLKEEMSGNDEGDEVVMTGM